ncbi:hypothetical protein CI610_01266 [invertebrate metagenome]|uniref:Uncharacterized protein n=1 Tax=invertebrate metagenome TaxID=1711999 RepID=A0A2H9T988_9ZZZZ
MDGSGGIKVQSQLQSTVQLKRGQTANAQMGKAADGQVVAGKANETSKLANMAEEMSMFVRDFNNKKSRFDKRKLSSGTSRQLEQVKKAQKAGKVDDLLQKAKAGGKMTQGEMQLLREFLQDSSYELDEQGRQAFSLLEEYASDEPELAEDMAELKQAFSETPGAIDADRQMSEVFSKAVQLKQGNIQDFKSPREAMLRLAEKCRDDKLAKAICNTQKMLGSELGQMKSASIQTEPVRFQTVINDIFTLKVLIALTEECQIAEAATNRQMVRQG